MRFFKRVLIKLKEPTVAVAVTAAVFLALSVGGVVAVILLSAPLTIAYACYFVSALFSGYIIYIAVYAWLKVRPRFFAWAEKRRLTKKFFCDYTFRTMLFAVGGFFMNVGYASFNAVYGILMAKHYGFAAISIWYCALAVYYVVLGVTRAVIVARTRAVNVAAGMDAAARNEKKMNIYRGTGALLLVLTLALISILWVMVRYPSMGFHYEGLLIFVAAAFTLYKIIFAVHSLLKVRGKEDYAVRAVRNINFTAALVSVLALQTAMLAAFSDGADYTWLTALVGTAICCSSAYTGTFMIVKSTVRLRKRRAQAIEDCENVDKI